MCIYIYIYTYIYIYYICQAWWCRPAIPGTQEVEVQSQSGQKVSKIPTQQISWEWWHMPVTPITQDKVGGLWFKFTQGKSKTLFEKKKKSKVGWIWGGSSGTVPT
jgi:hypothetical protein